MHIDDLAARCVVLIEVTNYAVTLIANAEEVFFAIDFCVRAVTLELFSSLQV